MYGKEIKLTRKSFNYTQVEVAKATGIPQSTISAWELGKNIPNIIDCIKLADFYGISLDDLIGREVKEKLK